MCQHCENVEVAALARRRVLGLMGAAALGLALVPAAAAAKGKAAPKPENALSPDAALDRLMKGNARYVAGKGHQRDLKHQREAVRGGQNPFAGVLSCADSRIGPEYCFDVGLGDIFVCRVAGNFATEQITASFEYAVEVLKTPAILVLGHESCGAVDAAIKSVKDGASFPGHLPSLIDALSPSVKAVESEGGDLLANAIRRNVAVNVEKLKTATPILSAAVSESRLKIVGGVYKLGSGHVELVAS